MNSDRKLIGALLLCAITAMGCASSPAHAPAPHAVTPMRDTTVIREDADTSGSTAESALPSGSVSMSERTSPKPDDAMKGGPVSLADLESLARAHNPTLLQASAQIEGSRGKAIQAGLWPNPTIGYIGDQIGVTNSAGTRSNTAGEFEGYIHQPAVRDCG